MADTKPVLIAQFLISMTMAFLMTGIFSLIELGISARSLGIWMQNFLTAWPIAFVLSIIVGKVAFGLAFRIRALGRKAA